MTCEPDTRVLGTYLSSEPVGVVGSMGSVGSLVEKQDLSPLELRAPLGGSRGLRQPDGLLRKGPSQRELFSYLHGAKKETRLERKHQTSGACYKRDYESDRENRSPERCSREHHRGADFSKSSLPERGRFDKVRWLWVPCWALKYIREGMGLEENGPCPGWDMGIWGCLRIWGWE